MGSFKDMYKKIFNPYNQKKEPVKYFIGNCASGGAAGATSLTVVYPLDFARTRLAAVVGIVAYRASYFGMFDTGKAMLFPDAEKASVFSMWAFAQVVTVSAGIISYLLDTKSIYVILDSGRKEKMYNG